jgi:hypothetical protein
MFNTPTTTIIMPLQSPIYPSSCLFSNSELLSLSQTQSILGVSLSSTRNITFRGQHDEGLAACVPENDNKLQVYKTWLQCWHEILQKEKRRKEMEAKNLGDLLTSKL